MLRTGRVLRWLGGFCGAVILVQTGPCGLDQTAMAQLLGSVFSDAAFFLLDNALVHLTT